MRWPKRALSLQAKIIASFTLIVVGGTVVSTLIGARIITNAMLEQARTRVRQGLAAVEELDRDQARQVQHALTAASASSDLRDALRTASPSALGLALARARDASGLDVVGYVEARGTRVVHAGDTAPSALPPALSAIVATALGGQEVVSTEVFDRDTLASWRPELARDAVVAVDRGAPGQPAAGPALTAGMLAFSAVPIRSGGAPGGVLYGGVLLNNRHGTVDRAEQFLYGRERYEGRQTGAVAILLGDVWVATNARRADGRRATGTVLPPHVAKAVVAGGQPWSGSITVDGEGHEAACSPLRDHAGNVVGAIYVAILRAPFLATRTQVMLTFLVVCLAGLLIVFGLTYALTRTMIGPLQEMVAATKRIAAGDLDVSVAVTSGDEIGELAGSFNNMLASLKTMNSELQQWAHTLKDRVRERSDELVSVQARMARSEKLASIGRLAAGVAHGLNNPLGGILSLTMLALEDMPSNHPLRADLETIVEQTLRCREIVKGLLDFARRSDTRMTPTDITQVVGSTLNLLGRQASLDDISVVRRLQPHLPPVLIDPGQLQEVLVNFAVNAADAMHGGGQLTVETASDEAAGEVILRVHDTGKGIPPEAMPMLFEPFFTTKEVGQGTGLGLAIAHAVVTGAGGRIEVDSHPGSTAFTVRLPVLRNGGTDGATATAGAGAGQPAGR